MKWVANESSPFQVTPSQSTWYHFISWPSFKPALTFHESVIPSTDRSNRHFTVRCTGPNTSLLRLALASTWLYAQCAQEDQMDPEIVISCRGSGKEVVSAVGGANKLVQARNNGNAIIPHESWMIAKGNSKSEAIGDDGRKWGLFSYAIMATIKRGDDEGVLEVSLSNSFGLLMKLRMGEYE